MFGKIKANPAWFAVLCIVQAFMVTAAYISFGDIVTLAVRWGVPAHLAWTAPVFIDGLTWMGKFGRGESFADKTRKAGLKLMAFGGAMSLAANVTVGETVGMRVYGALIVIGFVTAEWYSGQLKPRTSTAGEVSTKKAAPKATDQEKAARKRAGYDDMSDAEKRAWTKKYRANVSRRKTATAPVSPGRTPVDAPSVDEVAAIAR